MGEEDPLFFEGREEWRAWLDRHHAGEAEAWVVHNKKNTGAVNLTYEEALEEAICFGWIDGKMKSMGERSYLIRYSPRRPGSRWSRANVNRVERLTAQGKMTAAGLDSVKVAKERGAWEEAYDMREVLPLPPDLEKALKRRKGALAAFRALPQSRRYGYIDWVTKAKREDTRQRRIERVVDGLFE
jgi:uncharacterized protein YdeI (YjbR/CyaY-like superfamily)